MSDLNDPRVFFAAERTLLSWSRTSITLMGFGFLIERFGMFVKMTLGRQEEILHRSTSFWVGLIFIVCGILVAFLSSIQYRNVLKP